MQSYKVMFELTKWNLKIKNYVELKFKVRAAVFNKFGYYYFNYVELNCLVFIYIKVIDFLSACN